MGHDASPQLSARAGLLLPLLQFSQTQREKVRSDLARPGSCSCLRPPQMLLLETSTAPGWWLSRSDSLEGAGSAQPCAEQGDAESWGSDRGQSFRANLVK